MVQFKHLDTTSIEQNVQWIALEGSDVWETLRTPASISVGAVNSQTTLKLGMEFARVFPLRKS